MIEKVRLMEQRYNELSNKLSEPGIADDQKLFTDLMKEFKNLTPVVEKYREYEKAANSFNEAKELLEAGGMDKDFKEMGQSEFDESKALFANSLYRMYSMYAESKGWKQEILNAHPTELGGYKEISFSIEGEGAYSRLKYESGVHRVQRVPETESQGRIHTSTVTVAVLAEADEVELEINPADLKIDVFRASGAGGQHINKTESAVRITHLPTGCVVECQDERSQFKNKDKAMKILRSRLYEMLLNEQNDKIASERRTQVGTGDRSERIRTYNYPQGRLTDHRINLTIYRLEEILNGNLEEVLNALATADQAAKLAMQQNQ